MSKRPAIDLTALTSEAAAPMPEASQRMARLEPPATPSPAPQPPPQAKITSANLEGLSFRVSPGFRRRFRQRAVEADLKLNELLFEALDAWETQRGLKR